VDGVHPLLNDRLRAGQASMERDFLVAAVCNPQQALTNLEALTPEHFVDPQNREVFVTLRDVFARVADPDDQDSALAELQARAHSGSEAGPLFVRLVMEADQGRFSVAVLEELHLRLQEQHLMREIAALRATLDGDGDISEAQRRLVGKERVLQQVRASLTALDPEEGRV